MPAVRKPKPKSKKPMQYGPRWPLAVAKARLSEIARRARAEGPQIITSHGQDILEVRPAQTKRLHYTPTGTGLDFVLASIPYRSAASEDDLEFERDRTPALGRPADIP